MDARLEDNEPTAEEANDLLIRLMRGVSGQAFRMLGDKVRAGPFAGMIIPKRGPWDDGNSCTKLLGSYEHELHGAIDHAIWRNPSIIFNVGCAEGYYAIGLARLGRVPVYGIDISEESLMMCQDYAERNGVKVATRIGARAPEELRFPDEQGHRLYVMDCEGDEVTLLDPVRCPELVNSDIIVECHDFMEYGASRIVADRFSATHRVDLVRPRMPDLGRFLDLKFPTVMSVLMVVERRPMPSYWLTCWANSKGAYDG